MSEDTQANIIKNLILNEKGDIRMSRGYELPKWDINYKNFADPNNNMSYIGKILDDDLLYINKQTLLYSVNRVTLDFSPLTSEEVSTQETTISNTDNASYNNPINTPIITADSQVESKGSIIDSDTGVTLVEKPVKKTDETIISPTVKSSPKNRFGGKNNRQQILSSKVTEMFDASQIAMLRKQDYTNEQLNKMSEEELEHLKGCL